VGVKVVGNEKEGGSGMCQTVPICFGPRRSRFFSLLILLSSFILCISVSETLIFNPMNPKSDPLKNLINQKYRIGVAKNDTFIEQVRYEN
jgi:hypothetical protein